MGRTLKCKRRRKRFLAALWLCGGLLVLPAGRQARADGIDGLTLDEIRQKVEELESENAALREENEQLKDKIINALLGGSSGGDSSEDSDTVPESLSALSSLLGFGSGSSDSGSSSGSGVSDAGSGTGSGSTAGGTDSSAGSTGSSGSTSSASVQHTTDEFLAAVKASFEKRREITSQYTSAQLSAMSESESIEFRTACAEAERSFYNEYANAELDDLNIQYLCTEYTVGVGKQLQAGEVWESGGSTAQFNELYTAGYYNRAYALIELEDYYSLGLGDALDGMRASVKQRNEQDGEETRNAAVAADTVRQVQTLLNAAGFRCGEADGYAGRQTTSCIERFQTMYGYEPADGLIDDELIAQLQKAVGQ